MAYGDLYEFVVCLRQEGELLEVKEALDTKFEISALLREVGVSEGPALLVDRPKGYKMPVVGNLLGSRRRLALALESPPDALLETYQRAKEGPLAPKTVAQAGFREVTVSAPDVLRELPVLTYHQRDTGPYITQGVVFMADPETGKRTMGVHRMQVKGGGRLCVQLISPTSQEFLRRAEEREKPMPVAIAMGVTPAVLLAAVTWFPFGDKLALAGALQGAAMELVSCELSELLVPAHAMMVLEGEIPPGVRDTDGPFGESTGCYTTASSPVVEVKLLQRRQESLYSVFTPWTQEEDFILNLVWAGEALKKLRSEIPSVVDLSLSWNASTMTVSLRKRTDGDPRKAIYLGLLYNHYIKRVIVVDEDVDIHVPWELDWAMATRVQPDRDLVVLERVDGSPIDPSVGPEAMGSRYGVDATKPLGEAERFEKIAVPPRAAERARDLLRAR